ncbi:EscU/YscU/HrcU family type III secretion system export apparatus switch protein [Aquincola sp. S2]|uniref:EscU/YscU/HrcU family type III secretion system export apparatus switch protein n=1 Tax=Pseudaquabacterium terrae TaxID=2732868 RepID=A0ABX2EL89_9BURK|nr:EscU/YscU/HrcU family type III secretion system export apparatus switch protein [Aquabacterium terrae]NRF69408.1 EscU/YscU/HrcU family type III secretion system export apparatus switch protein [Aquabacterium terrae]
MTEKKHAPTRRALRLARRRGEVPYSADVTSTLVFAATSGAAAALAGWWFDSLHGLWHRATGAPVLRQPLEHLVALLLDAGRVSFGGMLLICAVALVAATAGGILQVGGMMAWQRLQPDFSRLNPASGLERIVSMRNLVNLLKLLVKAALLAALMSVVVRIHLQTAAGLGQLAPAMQAAAVGQALLSTFAWAGLICAAMAGVDHWHQRFEFMKQHRMSHEDLRRDHREAEGDPLNRSRRRSAHFESVYLSLADRMRAASLVVQSRRVAIALQYVGEQDLPRVIARGEGAVADRLQQLAADAQVPVQFDPALAERLFDEAALDRPIPAGCFEAVADLLRRAGWEVTQ